MANSAGDQSSRRDEAELLVAQILALMASVTQRFASEEGEGWRWITQHSQDPLVAEILRDSTPTALRVVNAIGQMEPVNGITIATQARIPKGTVSKVTRRLIVQNVVITESLPNNKKEVLFRLTPLGRELFQVHRAFDEQMERGFVRFLHHYDLSELRLLVRVLGEAAEASFLTLGQQTD